MQIKSAYHYDIQFRPTGQHGNADGFSRLPPNKIPLENTDYDSKLFNISQMEALSVTVHQWQAATGSDLVLSKVYRNIKKQWPMEIPV